MIRYLLILVGQIAEVLCPAPASVRAAVRDADWLAEREERVDVMEPFHWFDPASIKFGPSWSEFGPVAQEPTEELLLAAANQLDEWRNHTHFNQVREEYLCTLSRQLRDRATLFAQNR